MSSADRKEAVATLVSRLHSRPASYFYAVAAVAVATFARYQLDVALGFTQPFIFFYPAIILIALVAGFGPALIATLLSCFAVDYFFMEPLYSLSLANRRDLVGLILFGLLGTVLSGMGDLFRRRTKRLQEYEKAIEGLDDMIAVVDRDYRYVVANRAFLNYREMQTDDLVGRRIDEVLSAEVFHNTIKERMDECFRGNVVRYEMQYEYGKAGVRDLFVSYFPVETKAGIHRLVSVVQDVTHEKERIRSLRLFRELIDHSNDAVEVVDPETLQFFDVNEKACKALRYTREELLGMTMFDIDPSVDETKRAKVADELRDSGSVVQESIHRRKDGTTFPVETSLSQVELERSYLVVVTRDISERKRVIGEMQESEDRYRDLVEHSEDLVCTHDLKGNLLSVNPAPARILGYSVTELLSIPMRNMLPPECRGDFDDYLERIRTTGVDQGTLCVLTRHGEQRIWEYRNTLRTEGVTSPVVRGMARDITEQKRAQQALLKSELQYRLLFEKSLAGVAISSRGRVVDCNESWANMLGYAKPEEIRGRETKEFYFNQTEQQPLLEELKQVKAVSGREMQLLRKDGTPVWVLFNSVVHASTENNEPLLQATAIDITKRKEAEEALGRREEDYRRFVAQSSEGIFREDLKTPVPIDLPEDEMVLRIRREAYVSECNDALARMYGLGSSTELVGKRLAEMLVPDDAENLELMRKYIRSGFRVLEHESHEVDVHGNAKVFHNSMIGIVEDGKLLRTWGIQRDVTERATLEEARTAAEKALLASEVHFRSLVEQAPDGIFIADKDGKYVDVNSAGAQMLGYTREELLHLAIPDIVVAEEAARVGPEAARIAEGGVVRSQWKFRRKDASTFSRRSRRETTSRRTLAGNIAGRHRAHAGRGRNAEE